MRKSNIILLIVLLALLGIGMETQKRSGVEVINPTSSGENGAYEDLQARYDDLTTQYGELKRQYDAVSQNCENLQVQLQNTATGEGESTDVSQLVERIEICHEKTYEYGYDQYELVSWDGIGETQGIIVRDTNVTEDNPYIREGYALLKEKSSETYKLIIFPAVGVMPQ